MLICGDYAFGSAFNDVESAKRLGANSGRQPLHYLAAETNSAKPRMSRTLPK